MFAPMAEAFRSDLSQWIENATVIFNFETLNVFKDGHKLKDVNYAYVDTCYFRTFGIKVINKMAIAANKVALRNTRTEL